MSELLLDAAGRRRSPATLPGFHAGRPPRNKGHRCPAGPPTVEEIVAVPRTAGDGPWLPAARCDRRAVASGTAHPRGARAQPACPRPPSRRGARAPWLGRPPARRSAWTNGPASALRAPSAAPRPRRRVAHEGVPLIVIQRQLGHSNLGITSIDLQGIDNAEIIEAVHARRAPHRSRQRDASGRTQRRPSR
jgi:hypothetical protein